MYIFFCSSGQWWDKRGYLWWTGEAHETQEGQGKFPGHAKSKSDSLFWLYSTFTRGFFLPCMMHPEGLEGLGNTEPNKIGWLNRKIKAIQRTGWMGRQKGLMNSVELWDDYYKVCNYLNGNHLRIKYLKLCQEICGFKKGSASFLPVCENCTSQMVCLFSGRKLTSEFCAYLSHHLNSIS